MNRCSRLLILLVAALVALSLYGFFRLLELRFAAGDIYPPGSSLRTDPLGAKALHDALEQMPGVTVSRNYQELDKIGPAGGATILYIDLSPEPLPLDDVGKLNAAVKAGARLVIALKPQAPQTAKKTKPSKKPGALKAAKKKHGDTKEEEEDESEPETLEFPSFMQTWGAGIGYFQPSQISTPVLTANAADPDMEPAISWHTALFFLKPAPAWHVKYTCYGEPVIMERKLGSGSIVLAADSYFLTNEAMRKERDTRLLAWALGSSTRVVFDETHLGVREEPGIATLIRKYRLGGLVGALAVLAGLFVWKTSSSFLPPRPEIADSGIVTGKDSTAGFISLLRRGIAPARLVEVCMDQWKQSFARRPGKWSAALPRMEAAASDGARDPVATYQAISQILAEKK